METNKNQYTISIFTENHAGVVVNIASIFSRRKISLEGLNTSETEFENIYRFTIVVTVSEPVIKAIVNKIDRLVDVLFVFYNTQDEIIWQQQALYKIPTKMIMKEAKVEQLLRHYNAKAVVIRDDYTVFEVTGQREIIQNALHELKKYGLIEFVRGSRIAMKKSGMGMHEKLKEIEERDPTKDPVNNEYLHLRSKIFQM